MGLGLLLLLLQDWGKGMGLQGVRGEGRKGQWGRNEGGPDGRGRWENKGTWGWESWEQNGRGTGV